MEFDRHKIVFAPTNVILKKTISQKLCISWHGVQCVLTKI